MISRAIKCMLILLLLMLFICVPVAGEEEEDEDVKHYGNFEYRLMDDGSGVEITGYTRVWESVAIPARIEGEPVVRIGGFKNKSLIEVTIPETVTWISHEAFKDNNLKKITIPENVTHLGDGAFWGNKLREVTIPGNLTSVNSHVFFGNNLTEIVIPESVTEIGAWAFAHNQLTRVSMSNNTEVIGASSFSNNDLKELTIPNSVTSIGEDAFFLNLLTEITIPNSVTSIGGGAFARNQLNKVTIPSSVTTIADDAFEKNRANLIIYGVRTTAAESFARTRGYRFIDLTPPGQYILTISKEGQGTTDPATGVHVYDKDASVTITAIAVSGWSFKKWLVNGEEKNTASITLTMDADTTVAAHFVESEDDDEWIELTKAYDVPLYKVWVIIFNRVFSKHEVTSILVKKGDVPIPIDKIWEGDKKRVIVTPPSDNYLPGTLYNLRIVLNNDNRYVMYFHTKN